MQLPPNGGKRLSEIQQRILSCIAEAPGINRLRIALILRMPASTVGYYVQSLVDAGLVRRERDGRKAPLYPVQEDK